MESHLKVMGKASELIANHKGEAEAAALKLVKLFQNYCHY